MKKKMLITGASGFVGSHLTEQAKELGLEVHAAVRSTSKIEDIRPYVDQFVQPNFADVHALKELFETEQYHYIIHAAALTKAKSEAQMRAVNVGYTHNIVAAAVSAAMSLESLQYVSNPDESRMMEDVRKSLYEHRSYQTVHVYGRSKQASEERLCENFGGRPISVFRLTAVYGPRDR